MDYRRRFYFNPHLVDDGTSTYLMPIKNYNSTDYPAQDDDPDNTVAFGNTWLGYNTFAASRIEARRNTIKNEWLFRVLTSKDKYLRFVEFLMSHFGVDLGTVYYSELGIHYVNKLALSGSVTYKDLLNHILLSGAMQVRLDGHVSTKERPNANLAREMFELFSLGEGNYTEGDINESARVLCGPSLNGYYNTLNWPVGDVDTGVKNFSSHFNNAKTSTYGEDGIAFLVDMIFNTDKVGDFIANKIINAFFPGSNIPERYVSRIRVMINDGSTLREIYEYLIVVCHSVSLENTYNGIAQIIKSPLELLASISADMDIYMPENIINAYVVVDRLRRYLAEMGQDITEPPSIKGWEAHYQQPMLDKVWVNEATAVLRARLVDKLFDPWAFGDGMPENSFYIDVLRTVRNCPDASQPSVLVDWAVSRLGVDTFSVEEKLAIKNETLLSGQAEDRYWTTAWNIYSSDPTNEQSISIVKPRLESLFKYLLKHPKYQVQ